MNKVVVGIMLAVAFAIGCGVTVVAKQLVVPPAHAQDVQRWEYACAWTSSSMDDMTKSLNKFGAEGWELVTIVEKKQACFKRPL